MAQKTIFKKIIDREIPANLVHEDEFCIAFRVGGSQARRAGGTR
jgi:histidine triad (HIT) family protein